MPGRRFLRYARRALGVSSRRFARDDRGTVMVLTIAFALPLALFLFGSFNIGVGLLSRMRAQNAADAASYSASLWQARFLNYCAYTRRHIVGNFATIGLCTTYVNSDRMYKNIYDAEELSPTRNQDSDTFYSIKNQMQITRIALMIGIPIVKMIRDGSDTMNGFLSKSQLMLYQAVGTSCEGIMEKVVREASGRQETDFELDTGSSMSSLSTAGVLQSSQQKIPIPEVKAYFDDYTKADAINYIALLGHKDSAAGGWFGIYFPYPYQNEMSGFIWMINVKSDPMGVTDSKFETLDEVVVWSSWYVWFLFWITVYGIPVPIFVATPILEEGTADYDERKYDLSNTFSDVKVYEAKDSGTPKEPSCLAVVNVVENTAPFFRPMQTTPNDLFNSKPIRAFSRAKAYFLGWQENIQGGQYQRANLNYPFWGAQLAPLQHGHAQLKSRVTSELGSRSSTLMPEY